MLGVLYPYAIGISFCKGAYMVYIYYNTQWRGLAELLILTERQCEGQMSGISKEVSPTSFLCPYGNRIHNRSINLMLKRGEWQAKKRNGFIITNFY